MPDSTTAFFEQLSKRGHDQQLVEVTGNLRIDIGRDQGVDHWFLEIRNGDVQVSQEEHAADCVIRSDRALFDRITKGEENMHAAWIRDELTCEGDLLMFCYFLKVLPGPSRAHHPRSVAREGGDSHDERLGQHLGR